MSDETPVVPIEQPVVPEVPETPAPPVVPEPEKDWQAEAERERKRAENYLREIEVKGLRERKPDRTLPTLTSADGKFSEDQLVVVHNDYLSKREDVFHEMSSEISGLSEEEWGKAQGLLSAELDSVYSRATSQGRLTARGEIKDALAEVVKYVKRTVVPPVQNTMTQADIDKARLQGMKEQQQIDAAEIPGIRPRTPSPGQNSPVMDTDRKLAEENGRTPEREAEIRLAKEAREKQYAPRYSSLETE